MFISYKNKIPINKTYIIEIFLKNNYEFFIKYGKISLKCQINKDNIRLFLKDGGSYEKYTRNRFYSNNTRNSKS